MTTLHLPTAAGTLEAFTLSAPRHFPAQAERPFNRVAFSAAHVVADVRCRHRPLAAMCHRLGHHDRLPPHLWRLGLGVAEAMDTAQRGMGLDWPTSLELIRRSIDARATCPARCWPRAPAPTSSRPKPPGRSTT
jgi:hypothetical protein